MLTKKVLWSVANLFDFRKEVIILSKSYSFRILVIGQHFNSRIFLRNWVLPGGTPREWYLSVHDGSELCLCHCVGVRYAVPRILCRICICSQMLVYYYCRFFNFHLLCPDNTSWFIYQYLIRMIPSSWWIFVCFEWTHSLN